MMGDGYGFFYGGGLMWLLWILLIVLVAWGVKAAMASQGGRSRSALDILDERYASGEIDQQEFEQKRRDLRG
jgi:putative membrane protein